jgi:hypothetical protein
MSGNFNFNALHDRAFSSPLRSLVTLTRPVLLYAGRVRIPFAYFRTPRHRLCVFVFPRSGRANRFAERTRMLLHADEYLMMKAEWTRQAESTCV